jgi:hypothetical protein
MYRDLANGRFTGAKLEDFLAAYPPKLLLHHGPYTTAVYASVDLQFAMGRDYVVARNGKLVRAFSTGCVWTPVFFDGLTEEEWQDCAKGLSTAFQAHFALAPPLPAPAAPIDTNIPPPHEVGAKPNP